MPERRIPEVASRNRPWRALIGIAAIVIVIAAAFAYVGGWLDPGRLTPQKMTDTIQAANGKVYPGYRRAHSKGICIAGHFDSNGDGVALSKARVFAKGSVPIIGRMSIGGGAPYGPDAQARVRSMALLLKTDDGQEWRTAMNSFPFFVVSTAEAFNDQNIASRPDPVTGKPDPATMAAFGKAHPEAAPFQQWAKSAPWESSFANTAYNGVNAFRFTDAGGGERFVRWSMRPQAAYAEMSAGQRKTADNDYLQAELQQRLAKRPLRWDMVVTVANDDDVVTDPSKPWPDDRRHVVVGTLVVDHAEPQATGPCRDLNFDPLIVPDGISGSDDPILAARSAVYSVSFNRREREIGADRAPDASGNAAPAGEKK